MLFNLSYRLCFLGFLLAASAFDFEETAVPPICRPQLQTANCWYYRPNYVYNHLLDRCDWSGWSACNSKLNSFRTRAECERICLGNRRRPGNRLQEFDDFLSPNFIKEIPSRQRNLSYQKHQID